MNQAAQNCSVCSEKSAYLHEYPDGKDHHLICKDCLESVEGRMANPFKWHAFVNKYGNGSGWFEHLPLLHQAINTLHCK